MGLWVSRRVGFQGFGTPGEGRRKGPQMEKEGDPFSQPHHVTAGLMVGAALCVSPRPSHPAEDRGSSSEAFLELPEAVQAFFFFLPAAGVSDHLGCRALVVAHPTPTHSSVTWRG